MKRNQCGPRQAPNWFLWVKSLVAKYIPEGEGLANEGWDLWMNEIEGTCSDWRASYFELMVRRS